jgi:hypothetical protein
VIRTALVAGFAVLLAGAVEATHPSPPAGFEAALIGLLDVPFVYDADQADPGSPGSTRLDARAEPFETAPVIATVDRDGIATREGTRCFWQREPQCRYHEAGYEEPAVAVFARRITRPVEAPPGTWYRIALDPEGRRFGWVRSEARYRELAALVVTQERLTYLTPAWRGTLVDRPGAATSRPATPARDPRPQRAARAIRPAMIAGRLWVEVELYDGVCDGGERVVDKGWVPLRDATGALLLWYWSRGC